MARGPSLISTPLEIISLTLVVEAINKQIVLHASDSSARYPEISGGASAILLKEFLKPLAFGLGRGNDLADCGDF
jgi:hypothetical protein